jgi:hypothetical protein
MGCHVFVDETKARGFTLVAVRVDNRDVARLRKAMRSLLLPGQERIHFRKESDSRRRLVLSELAGHLLQPIAITATARDQRLARESSLRLFLDSLTGDDPTHLVVELDESVERSDARMLETATRKSGAPTNLSFELLPPRHDPGLWVADAIAWADQRGGDWSRRIAMHPIQRLQS